jgi:cytochrome c2
LPASGLPGARYSAGAGWLGRTDIDMQATTSTGHRTRLGRRVAIGAAAALLLAALLAGWLSHIVPGAPAPSAIGGDAARGQRLLAQYQCGTCHQIGGVIAAQGMLGPSLHAVVRRAYLAGEVPNSPDTLRRWIVDPAALVPGTPMPNMGVDDAAARDIVAYLATLE